MLKQIDTFILERIFTPFAWWVERQTGWTNFRLAATAVSVAMLTCMVIAGVEATQHVVSWIIVVVFSIMASFFGFWAFGVSLMNATEMPEKQKMIKASREPSPTRAILIISMITSFISFATSKTYGFGNILTNHTVFLLYAIAFECFAYNCGSYFIGVKPKAVPVQRMGPWGKRTEEGR